MDICPAYDVAKEPATRTALQRAKYADMRRRMAERDSNPGGRGSPNRQSNSNKPICRQWQNGHCNYGDDCRFAHSNNGRRKGGKGDRGRNGRRGSPKGGGKGGKGGGKRQFKRMANMLFDHVSNAIERTAPGNSDVDVEGSSNSEERPAKKQQSGWLKEAKKSFMKAMKEKQDKGSFMIRRSIEPVANQRVVMFESGKFTDNHLHDAWYAGIDSDGSGALTTNPGDAIDGLAIYDPEVLRQFNQCVQYQTGNGPISICGLSPLTFPTKDENGRDVALTLPYGRIVDKGD